MSSLTASLFIGTAIKGSPELVTLEHIERVLDTYGFPRNAPEIVSGVYTHEDGEKVKERTFRFALTLPQLIAWNNNFEGGDFLSRIAKELRQESVLVEIDGTAALHFADGRGLFTIGDFFPLEEGQEADNYTETATGFRYTFRLRK